MVLLLAVAGLGLALASTWVHYRLLTDPGYVSPCNFNAHFSCTQVYLSPYGAVAGVPVALGGVLWFALVALAGPVSNLALAAVGGVVLEALLAASTGESPSLLVRTLFMAVLLNVMLAVFNMVPVPPLDGGNVLMGVVPWQAARWINWP